MMLRMIRYYYYLCLSLCWMAVKAMLMKMMMMMMMIVQVLTLFERPLESRLFRRPYGTIEWLAWDRL